MYLYGKKWLFIYLIKQNFPNFNRVLWNGWTVNGVCIKTNDKRKEKSIEYINRVCRAKMHRRRKT